MKKAKFPAFLSTAIVCYIFWLLITGALTDLCKGSVNTQVLIAGGIVSILVALFSARFFIHESAFYLFNPLKFFVLLFYCLIIFPWELIKANVDVAFRAFSPKLRIKPGFVKVPTELKGEYGLSMLANSITLTPGTITMDIVDEGGKTYYYIHWIHVAETEGKKAGEAIKGTLEKWIRRIFK